MSRWRWLVCVLACWGGGLAAPAASAPFDRTVIQALVVEEARRIGVEPALALAVAHVESAFDPLAISSAGARGVMQVMPATVRGEYGLHEDVLWQPRLNIRIGLHFLESLLDRYNGRHPYALSWYNGGSRVGPPENPRIIPATRVYVERVERFYRRYRQDAATGAQAWQTAWLGGD